MKRRQRLKKNASRRPKGLGTMKLHEDGTRTYTYTIPKQLTGGRRERVEKRLAPMSALEAEKEAERIRAEAEHRNPATNKRMTFNQLADSYLAACSRERELQRTTVDLYRRNLKVHIRPAIGERRVSELTTYDVTKMLYDAKDASRTKKRGRPISDAVRDNLRVEVRACLEWARRMKLVKINVADDITPPKAQPKKPSFIERTDVKALVPKLVAAAKGTEVEVIVPFALGTGMRRGEICALRWADVNLELGTIRVWESSANADVVDPKPGQLKREVIIKTPKSKKSDRTLLVAQSVIELLRKHRVQQIEKNFAAGHGYRSDEARVFQRDDGRDWDPNELGRIFGKTMKAKGIKGVTPHSLRHSFASLAYAAGVPIKVISEMLGHSSVAITMEIYVHVFKSSLSESARAIDSFFGESLLSA